MDRVLVLDSETGEAMSFIRSLGGRDVVVTAGGPKRYSPGMLSRFATDRYIYPDPRTDIDQFVDHLTSYLTVRDYFAVFALTDPTTSVLSKYKDRLAATGTRIGVEDWATHQAANDKAKLLDHIPPEVPTPDAYRPESITEVDELAHNIVYPAVIKPRRSSEWDSSGQYHAQLITDDNYVESPAELRTRYRDLVNRDPVLQYRLPIIQEYVTGDTIATMALADEGDVQVYFQHKHLRKTKDGSGPVYEGVRELRMQEHTKQVVNQLGWTGPLYAEFIHGPDDQFYLIEVNGRYWGGLPLAINSGVDFPWLHHLQLRGSDYQADNHYRTDVTQRTLFYTDITWLVDKLSQGEYDALWPFLTAFMTTKEPFLSLRDPLPLASVLLETVNKYRHVPGRLATKCHDSILQQGKFS